MTFRSDDEYWAWVDRQIRWREKLYKASRYAALLGAAVLLLFALPCRCHDTCHFILGIFLAKSEIIAVAHYKAYAEREPANSPIICLYTFLVAHIKHHLDVALPYYI